jgi:hypothetical protein
MLETQQILQLDDLGFLTKKQILMIDEALAKVNSYGEVRLIVEKGRLRFLVTQESVDALKWQPAILDSKE